MLGLLLWLACGGEDQLGDEGQGLLDSGPGCDLCAGGCVEQEEPTSREHVEGELDYADPPPMGGNHSACWAAWGVHQTEVPDEQWVHNLEHGGVVFLYACPDGCAEELGELSAFVTARGSRALLTPYAALPWRFAAVAWGWRLGQDCLDMEAMETFYTNHVDEGPERSSAAPAEGCM